MIPANEVGEQLLFMLDERYAFERARVDIAYRRKPNPDNPLMPSRSWVWSISDRHGSAALEVCFSWGDGPTDHGLELRYVVDDRRSLTLIVCEYNDLFTEWGGSLRDGDEHRVPAEYLSLISDDLVDAWLDGRLIALRRRFFGWFYWEVRLDGRWRSSNNWLVSLLTIRKRHQSPSWAAPSGTEH